ncbi:unnamed protein product, partial [Phaeothamnion confervicola]
KRQSWFFFTRYIDANYLHPIPFELMVDHGGSDPSKFSVSKVFYAGAIYNSTTELMELWKDPDSGIPRVDLNDPVKDPGPVYSSYELRKPMRPLSNKPGPVPFEPKGRRFTIDRNEVKWMGWKFGVGVSGVTGTRLWDISFKGERIAYEISMQE